MVVNDEDAISCKAPPGMVINPKVEDVMAIRQDEKGALLRRSFLGSREDLVEVYQKRRNSPSKSSNAGRRLSQIRPSQVYSKFILLQNVAVFNVSLEKKRQTAKNEQA